MPSDIFGDFYFDGDELAILVSETIRHLPLYKFNFKKNNQNGLWVSVSDSKGEKQSANKKGVYLIYEKKYNKVSCLYVGKSDGENCIHRRLYRWGAEILDIKKRYDQTHPAASKARQDGIRSSRHLYVKYMTWEEIENIMPKVEKRYDRDILDEKVAFVVKPKYNHKGLKYGSRN